MKNYLFPITYAPKTILIFLLFGKIRAYKYVTSKLLESLHKCSNDELIDALNSTLSTKKLICPSNLSFFNNRASYLTRIVLYYLIRLYRPRIVVETGVWTGKSSWFILSALRDNDYGELYSIDLGVKTIGNEKLPVANIGGIVPELLRDRWHLILGDSFIELPKLIKKIGVVDLFFHDSGHYYELMLFEYESIYPILSNEGYLCSDDIDFSEAWSYFIKKTNSQDYILQNKMGIVKRR